MLSSKHQLDFTYKSVWSNKGLFFKRKSAPILDYNTYKTEVDNSDQLVAYCFTFYHYLHILK